MGRHDQLHTDVIDIPMDKLVQRCDRLTISLDTSIFELSFKPHAVISTEDARALKLSVRKFPFIPETAERQGVTFISRLRTTLLF